MNRASEEKDSRSSIENKPTQTTNDRILVVDEIEEVCGDSISSILTSVGYKCRTASDALDALAVLNSGEEFDLLVANLRMPSLDGIGLLRRTKEQFPDMPVAIESAVDDISVTRKAIQNDAYRYLLKPVEPVKLLIVVRNALRYRRRNLENPFDIACTNCHASKRQIDAWQAKYGPIRSCCQGPDEDLMLRSLPRGEDR